MFQRHHLPVSLIHPVERGLALRLFRIRRHLFREGGHFVGCHDGTAHIQGLRQQDGACPEVACVGAQRIHQVLARAVEGRRGLPKVGAQLLLHGCGQHLCVSRQTALQTNRHSGTQASQCRLLCIAQQGYFAAGMLVGSQGTDVRQIFSAGRPANISRHVAPQLRHPHLLIVPQRHRPATVEAQHRLTIADRT